MNKFILSVLTLILAIPAMAVEQKSPNGKVVVLSLIHI